VPVFYHHNINHDTRLGVWKIEEDEQFFLQKVPAQRNISHTHKRLQHLAGRYLLKHLFHDFPNELILIADTRKPFLLNDPFHFSISHCGDFAAAIVSKSSRVGVDVEMVAPKIQQVSRKFLNDSEDMYLSGWKDIPKVYLEMLTMIWSAKEAIYKWYGNGEVDFKKHISINGTITIRPDESIRMPFVFSRDKPMHVTVEGKLFHHLVLAHLTH
jgi:phosphopantetheinyl transferase